MQSPLLKVILISVICLVLWSKCQALRCRTDDGPSEEDLKRIVRICMHGVGENDTDDDYNYDDSDSDRSEDEMFTERSSRPLHLNRQNNPYGNVNPNSNSQRHFDNRNNNNWNGRTEQFGGINNQYSNQNPNLNQNFNRNPGNSYNNNKPNRNNNQTEKDRACLVHCFFHELKMIKETLTKDIREREVKEFYVDSIQECFHMVDNMDNYNRRKNKCDVALTITTCLAERARTNCEDFRNNMMIF